jgi:hypothetical protein
MRQLAITVLAAAIILPATAAAQIKTLPGEAITVNATVEAIQHSKRTLTLKGPEGNLVDVVVPPEVKRFDTIKVGDTISAKYYENVVLRVKAPGEKAVDTLTGGVTTGKGAKAGGTVAAQRTITATITAIDPKVPSISLAGPNNWKYSSRVADKEALSKVKVGDRLDITWTEAVLISADPPKK